MTSTEPKLFDFRKPCRLPYHVEQQVLDWQRRACRLLGRKLAPHLPFSTQWTATTPESLDVKTSELPEFVSAYQVHVEGFQQSTYLAIPSELAIAFVQGLLGRDTKEMPDPRKVTKIEVNMLEVIAETIIDAINEGGNGAGYPVCQLIKHEPVPQIIRLYPAEVEVLALHFTVSSTFGEGAIQWLLPQSLTDSLFEEVEQAEPPVEDPETPRQLEEVALRVPMEIVVQLGQVQLPLADLGNLAAGDVLVLDQRVSEPLDCMIQDEIGMKAWPGVTAGKQSVLVQTPPGDDVC